MTICDDSHPSLDAAVGQHQATVGARNVEYSRRQDSSTMQTSGSEAKQACKEKEREMLGWDGGQ